MSDIAIKVENLSKLYRIGKRESYQTLRDRLSASFGKIFSGKKPGSDNEDKIWALKEVSFDIKKGGVVGIIGRNGAGKSTLLKILSRITEPTKGSVDLYGKVSSLLEVGTGFHPELTGRENIYLNAAILGMKRKEINKKFDEMVAFAEVEKFIDTPVKHFSSGMYMRLAFSVAAHLDPEILLVDEVLAVGDAAFQKKCLGKMDAAAHQGRTILFINHNMGHIRRLCNSIIWLENGQLKQSGSVAEVTAAYQKSLSQVSTKGISANLPANGFVSWKIAEKESNLIEEEGPFTLQVNLCLKKTVYDAYHSLVLRSADGQNIGGWGFSGLHLKPGTYCLNYRFPSLPVRPGVYYWYTSLWDGSAKIDTGYLFPELIVGTPEHSLINNEDLAGVLNIKCDMAIKSISGDSAAC